MSAVVKWGLQSEMGKICKGAVALLRDAQGRAVGGVCVKRPTV